MLQMVERHDATAKSTCVQEQNNAMTATKYLKTALWLLAAALWVGI